MSEMLAALTNIRTAEDMVVAFRDEEQCRRLCSPWIVSGFSLSSFQTMHYAILEARREHHGNKP